jgi:hypothetical protein
MRLGSAAGAIAIVALLGALAAPAPARPRATPTPSPTPTPIADPAITKLVTQQFVSLQAGEISKSLYDEQILAKLTDEKLAETSKVLGSLGALTQVVYIGPWLASDFPPGARGFIYQMRCADGSVYLFLALDPQGKIATMLLKNRLDVETITAPPSSPPSP